jgi:hypothetical protein
MNQSPLEIVTTALVNTAPADIASCFGIGPVGAQMIGLIETLQGK